MATAAEPRVVSAPPRNGWRIVALKETADHLHSIRLLILVILLGLVGVATVFTAASGIREAATGASGAPALFLALFTFSPEDSRLPPFLTLFGLLAPLLGIAFGFDAVNGERSQGTLPRLLSQPIYRDDVVNGKFAAGLGVIGVVLLALVLFVSALGFVRIGVTPSWDEAARLFAFYLVSLAYVGFWLGLAALFSVVLRRAASSALAAIAVWLVATLFSALLVGIVADVMSPVPDQPTFEEQLDNAKLQVSLARLSPATLYEEASSVLLNPQQRALGIIFVQQLDRAIPTDTLPLDQSIILALGQVVGLIALTVLTFAAAYVAFMRQEVRA